MAPFVKIGFPIGDDCRPASTATRVIIPVTTVRIGFSPSKVIDDTLIQNIPAAVAAKGLSAQEWTKAMTELKKVVNDNIWSVLTYVLIGFTVIFLPLIAVIYGRLHREVAKFMAGFNEKLM
ncbi:hypothetical protein HDU99_007785, partial [Rhizoclosmatium hyalinum]